MSLGWKDRKSVNAVLKALVGSISSKLQEQGELSAIDHLVNADLS
jgi:hypothetical protein